MTSRRAPQFVSVPELARDLGMDKSSLYWYLERVKAKTEQLGDAKNSVRFVRRDQVVDIVAAIQAYRSRKPQGLTTADVAARLGIAPSTVRVLVVQKRLKARHAGKRLIFDEASVERYARGRRPAVA
jgi:DNA-binding CsgD family transcriptional regulator